MRILGRVLWAASVLHPAGDPPAARAAQPLSVPLVVVETSKGTFAFTTYPNEAPKTVAHIVALVRVAFYDGQRIHRAIPTFVVQFGDPQTRDDSKRAQWGRGAAAS